MAADRSKAVPLPTINPSVTYKMSTPTPAPKPAAAADRSKAVPVPRINRSAPAQNRIQGVAPTEYAIQFIASRQSLTHQEFVGHAFMVISTPVANGVKEDGYGFYPGSKGAIISGPGVVKSEMSTNPSRFSRAAISIRQPLTDTQRAAVLKLAREWNSKGYKLTDQNCIDFVASAAKAAGMKVPPRSKSERPASYLRKLKAANPNPK
jgi:hypothetical protein